MKLGSVWLGILSSRPIAGILPAPLVIFATFTGYIAGGWLGALAITAGMFLPAFAFSMIFYERLEAVVENPALHKFLGGVAAAVVGVIVATMVQLAMSVKERVTCYVAAIAIFLVCLVAVWKIKGKWVMPAIILAAGTTGWLSNPQRNAAAIIHPSSNTTFLQITILVILIRESEVCDGECRN